MLSVEDSKPAVVGGATAVGASFAMNPTMSVGLGALLAVVTKSRTDPEANFLLVGGLMFVFVGLGGILLGSFPGAPVAAIGIGGGLVGATFLWVGRKVDQWALGRIARFVWTLINFNATLVLIAKVALVLPLTFAAGVLGTDVPIIGDFAFVFYCIAVLAGFYVLDQGKSILQVRRKIRGNRRGASVEDVKNAAVTAEATAQKAEDVAAATRDADAEDVKEAASTAKETVSSVRSGADDDIESDDAATASETSGTVSDGLDASAADESPTADESPAADESPVDSVTGEETTANAATDSESVSTDWLTEPSDPTLVVRNVSPERKSVRVGCRVDGQKRLADDVRLAAGEAADWDDLPTDSQFEVGIVVDGGPSEGKRFDPDDLTDEIRVVLTDGSVEFGEGDAQSSRSETTSRETEPSRDQSRSDDAGSETGDATAGSSSESPSGGGSSSGSPSGGGTSGSPSGGASSESASTGASAGSSSAASKVFGGSSDDDGGAASDESIETASELADAVRQSPTEEQVVRLTTFLDSATPSERAAAVRGLRQSVKEYPEPVVPVVSSVAALLRDDDAQTRQEAIVTLQRLAETRPSAVTDATNAIVDALDDDSAKVRTAACRTLDETGANVGSEKLEELADEDPHKGVQVAAYHALQSVQR